jgi:hypothetical protein
MEIERTLFYAADRFPEGTLQHMILFGFDNWNLEQIEMSAEGNNIQLQNFSIQTILESLSLQHDDITEHHSALLCHAYCHLQLELDGPNVLEESEERFSWDQMIPEASLPSQKFLTTIGVMASLFLILWIGKGYWFHSAMQSRVQKSDSLIKLSSYLKREELGLQKMIRGHLDYSELYIFLSDVLSDDTTRNVLVKNLSLDAKTGVELALIGANHTNAVTILEKLNSSQYFRNIYIDRSVVEKQGLTIYLKGKLRVTS